MCGIFGIINSAANGALPSSWKKIAAASIRRRGPDNQSYECFPLGPWDFHVFHSRLAILGLETGSNQPFSSQCGRWRLVYNGEIYNYLELRQELQGRGEVFHTGSDTEVLLRCWSLWGADALPKLNGMFAFGIYDLQERRLTLVRDRFGVKPLFIHARERVLFGSSQAGVACLAQAEPDRTYLGRGLVYGVYEYADGGSAFRGIESVQPGTLVEFDFSGEQYRMVRRRWYDLGAAVAACAEQIHSLTYAQIESQCGALLKSAVELRLRTDVPFAVSLSGGIDSSSIASIVGRRSMNVHGFTFGSPDAPRSEGPTVAQFAAQHDVHMHYVWPELSGARLAQAFERTIEFQEAPIGFGGLSIVAQNEVYREVREYGFKVLLGGQGGDEAFAGYRKYFVVALSESIRSKRVGESLGHLWSLGLMLLSEASQWRTYLRSLERYTKLKPAGFQLLNLEVEPMNLWGRDFADTSSRQIEDFLSFSIPTLLRYEDRNSMGFGVESRLPFMDYRLVEFALALPAALKLRNGYGKWILRRCMEGMVPNSILLTRKKRGFDVTQDWMAMGLGDHLRNTIVGNEKLRPYCRDFSRLASVLEGGSLVRDSRLAAEAMTLHWLTQPIRLKEGA